MWAPYNRHAKSKPWNGVCAGLHRNGNACFTFRAAPDDEFPEWFKPGHLCNVLVGTGEHAGMVRFVCGGGVPIRHTVNHTNPKIVVLGFRPPGDLFPSTPCEYDYHDDWFDVTLPKSWFTAEPVAPKADTREMGKRLLAMDNNVCAVPSALEAFTAGRLLTHAPGAPFRMIDRIRDG